MAGIKIVDLPPLGRDLASTDLLELSLAGGTGSRKITGQEIMNASKLSINNTPIINGTVGRILFQGAGDVLQQSSSLFWDATNNRLGIGTETPATKLHIKAETTSTSAIIIENPSSGSVYLPTTTYVTGLNQTTAGSNNASYLLMAAGPGSGTPSQGPYFQLNGNLHTAYGGQRGYIQFTSGQVTSPTGNDGKIAFNCASSAIDFNTAGTNKLSIQNNGNVLINTTTDAGFRLDVNGTARVRGTGTTSATTAFTVTNSGAAYNSLIIRDDGTFVFGNPNNGGAYLTGASNGNITATYFNAGLDLGAGRKVTSVQYFSSGSITASSALAQGVYFNNTLVAAANNDVLVGLDINPTFTNGAFTGVDNFSLRITSGKGVVGTTSNAGAFPLIVRQNNYSGLLVQNSFTGTNHNSSYDGFAFWTNNDTSFAKSLITNWDNNGIYIYNAGASSTGLILFGSTNNVGINTTTDAGYKLDVNGDSRLKGSGSTLLTYALTVQNSSGTNLLAVRNNNTTYISDTVTINAQTPGGTGMVISHLAWNGSTGLSVNSAIGIVAWSSLGADSDNPDGASIVALGRVGGDPLRKSVGLRSNRAIISAGLARDIVDSAMLQVDSTTQGFLPPRMTQAQRNAIASPAIGLEIYQTDATEGKYIYKSSGWTYIG